MLHVCPLDGTIEWLGAIGKSQRRHDAVTTPGASYTGLAISSKTSGNVLLAADNANNRIDLYNATFKLT